MPLVRGYAFHGSHVEVGYLDSCLKYWIEIGSCNIGLSSRIKHGICLVDWWSQCSHEPTLARESGMLNCYEIIYSKHLEKILICEWPNLEKARSMNIMANILKIISDQIICMDGNSTMVYARSDTRKSTYRRYFYLYISQTFKWEEICFKVFNL